MLSYRLARRRRASLIASIVGMICAAAAAAQPLDWRREWPRTDFTRHRVDFTEIESGGPPKDGIPAIDQPRFERLSRGKASGWAATLAETEPVISLAIGDDVRAYPIRILIWHEIVNDTVGGEPVVVTYCPLCNAALVFKRMVGGRELDFGTTGKLHNSDLVMYDRQTESWWQQFTGEAVIGELAGHSLKLIPSRVESLARFQERFPSGQVLVPSDPNLRRYGSNPYEGYDAENRKPFLYDGRMPEGIEPMARVVAVEVAPGQHEAWSLALVRQKREIRHGDIILRWEPGQNSALDKGAVASGRDIGNIVVQRKFGTGLIDVAYDVPFAFAFHAFRPQASIHTR